nr:MazG-like family protein [Halomarina oriensis]
MHTTPAYRLLDLVSEVGELAKNVNTSTGYGDDPTAADVEEDEVGDALFCLLALCEETGIDADDALATALAKYEDRLETTGQAGRGT